MLKIGLTGGIGTGKSLVTSFLQDQGANVINADLLGHEAYLPGTVGFEQVVSEFGEDIVGADGHVDRQKLGPIVFSDPSNMDRLNAIMHPLIKDMIQTQLDDVEGKGQLIAIVEAAVLIEAGWESLFDEIWVVTADEEEIISRLASRNGLSREDSQKRINSQMTSIERSAHGDVIINNTGSVEDLKENVESLWAQRVSR
jgi:dephospho-CoA kinase|tara:strand:- start:391 stop:987 length:597 start_codon:yes stop_codon:yes gene_type:complete